MSRDDMLDAVHDEVTANDTGMEDSVTSLLEEIVRLRRIEAPARRVAMGWLRIAHGSWLPSEAEWAEMDAAWAELRKALGMTPDPEAA